MRPVGVVGPTPALDVKLGVGQGEKPILVEAFVAQLPVDACDVGVLHGLARLDEAELNPAIRGPRVERPTTKLTPVVQREPRRLAAHDDRRHARDGMRDPNGRRFVPGMIHDGEAAEAAAPGELIAHEVDAPRIVGAARHGTRHPRDGETLPVPSTDREVLEPIQPLDTLVVHVLAFATQSPVQARHAPARIRAGQLPQARAQRRIPRRPDRLTAERRPFEPHRAARVPLAHVVAPLHVRDHRPAPLGGHAPFPKTSFRIWRLSA